MTNKFKKEKSMNKSAAFSAGVVDVLEKTAISKEVVKRTAKARGVPEGYLRQIAKLRSSRAGRSKIPTAVAQRHNARSGSVTGVGKKYLESWNSNK